MTLRWPLALALVAACTPLAPEFVCASDGACVNGALQGTCEANGECSFPDGSCGANGRRYGAGGPLDGQCVAVSTCGNLGQGCCASGPACASASLTCRAGVCGGCVLGVGGGAAHSCALRSDGEVFCWGANDAGQLGDHTLAARSAPGAVLDSQGTPLDRVVAISAGDAHTCALRDDGTALCWGDDGDGQLGVGGGAAQNPVPQLIGLTTIAHLAAGARHTCADLQNGLVYCWGKNDQGQIGSPAPAGNSSPAAVLTAQSTQLDGGGALAAGAGHSCALRGAALWCWGGDSDGELGDGAVRASGAPVEVVALGAHVVAAAAGAAFTCAVDDGGGLSCWGANDSGQAAAPPAPSVAAPMVVAGFGGAVEVAAGASHACARKGDGSAWCWGANARGQLGQNDAADRSAPTELGGVRFGALAGGAAHTCGATAGGVSCWGAGDAGQLGDGKMQDSPVPVAALLSCP